MTLRTAAVLVPCLLLLAAAAPADEPDDEKEADLLSAKTFAGLKLRSLGPALTSGRISEVAVRADDPATWYVAVSSGGVWKTTNAGTTFEPIFDEAGSYSIGCVTIDPNDPNVVWVGTGENNNQRSVAYGDGVYKSVDGGRSWENVGLKESEHVAKILVDPRDSDVVYVAAQGPLWRAGGDRGLYKTTDGGKTWSRVLETSEHTGVTDAWLDPRNPDVLYAATHQRRRHVWTYLGGGPESAIHKSRDAGASWTKLSKGLPEGDKGRIGLAVSPVEPDVVYAMVEAEEKGGFYRSADAGASWEKRSDHVTSGNYYVELVPDPHDADRVYSMDTWLQVTEDGGRTFRRVDEKAKHVDNHSLWIDPKDADHLIAGCDGGLYESWDRGATWHFKPNLPVTQFYKVAVDDAEPFYHVYGGTQDNNTLGGPSRTRTAHGIRNEDWFVTVGGDGFEPAVEPGNPDIVYSQSQYGNLVRHDRRTGEIVDVQPQPESGEDPLRWNWDAALLISPHSPTRLYFAAQRVFRSDDRGESWTPVSPDLTRQIDRNRLKVMGRVWSIDAINKNRFTSPYGNVVALSESPLVEGLLYAGTDDGLVQVTEDGGRTWRRIESFPGVPDRTYVYDLKASLHDADTVYASFNNHKMGDFEPYLLKSADRGRSWKPIGGDLPERGSTYAVAEDHVRADLLFVGTEFGVYFTLDGGGQWIELTGGMPTIAVRDVEIQRGENDLVLATFGRGFYVLDDYSPLRGVSRAELQKEALLFEPRGAFVYEPARPLSLPGKAFMGDAYYAAENPPFGAVFTYYLNEELKTMRKERRDREKEAAEKGGDNPYPGWEVVRAEDAEEEPQVILTVRDADGRVVRRITGPVEAGFHRVAWDLRYPPVWPVDLSEPEEYNPWRPVPRGPFAAPGTYTVELARRVRGELSPLAGPLRFTTEVLGAASLPEPDRADAEAFHRRLARLQRAVMGASEAVGETEKRIAHLRRGLLDTTAAEASWLEELDGLESRLRELKVALKGDEVLSEREEPSPLSIDARVQRVVEMAFTTTGGITKTQRRAYEIAAEAFAFVLGRLRTLVEGDLAAFEKRAEEAGAPWTPGRVPLWSRE